MDLDRLESVVLTKLKHGIDDDIKSRFPDINFVSEPNTAKTKFPNVNVQEMESQATSTNLLNQSGGINSAFTITVNTNTSKQDGMTVARECKRLMCEMGYICTSIFYQKPNDVHICIFRARRTLCIGDNI